MVVRLPTVVVDAFCIVTGLNDNSSLAPESQSRRELSKDMVDSGRYLTQESGVGS